MAHGQAGAEISEERCPTLTCNHEAPIAAYSVSLRGREGGGTAELGDDLAGTLRASGGGGDKPHVLQAVFDPNQITSRTNRSTPTPELCYTLPGTPNAPVTFCVHGTQDPCIGVEHAHALGRNSGQENAVCVTGAVTHTLTAEGFDASEDGTGRGQPITATDMAVRRLMPVECERLQGFTDGWTDVPVGNGIAADGPRYKQLGNSWAVPCVRWIGGRIAAALEAMPVREADYDEALATWMVAA